MQYNLASALTLINCFDLKVNLGEKKTLFGFLYSYFLGSKKDKRNLPLEQAIEEGNLNLVNALLGVGTKSTIELSKKAMEKGYLTIMHRLLFTSLLDVSEQQRYPQITHLSCLFK